MKEGRGSDNGKVRTSMDVLLRVCVQLMLLVFSLTAASIVWLPATSNP